MSTDSDAFHAITLRKHLESYGFDDGYFGKLIRACMITVIKDDFSGSYQSALEPVEAKQKSKDRVIPVSQFLSAGDMLKFSGTMKSMAPPPLTAMPALLNFFKKPFTTPILMTLWLIGKIMRLNLDKMSYIEGWVCEHKNPPFSIFPFDQWITVTSIEATWLNLYSPEGQMWRLGTVVLTDPEHINFCKHANTGQITDFINSST